MTAPGAANGRPERRVVTAEAIAARRRAQLVSGLRGLSAGAGTEKRRAPVPPGSETQGRSVVGETETALAAGDERCDLCGLSVPAEHRHLLHLAERRIVCSCEACWAMRAGEGDYRPTGTRTVWLPDLELPDDLWASFQIPIGLAFFLHSAVTDCVVAMYPSPAGATESELHFESWERMRALNPILNELERDIEGLVVNRLADPPVYAIAPIDQCYALTGAIKMSWEGISGGAGVEEAVARFFAGLREKAGAV